MLGISCVVEFDIAIFACRVGCGNLIVRRRERGKGMDGKQMGLKKQQNSIPFHSIKLKSCKILISVFAISFLIRYM